MSVARALLPAQPTEPVPGLPPFQGGIAGYIGYDWGAVLERLPAPAYDDLAVPDVVLGLYDWVIAWDHRIGTAWLISTGLPESGEAQARRARRADGPGAGAAGGTGGGGRRAGRAAAGRWAEQPDCPAAPLAPSYPVMGIEGAEKIGLRSTFTHRGYLDAVARVREYILAGDIFQANLSQRFQAPLSRTAVRALPAAPAAEPGAVRRLSRIRRGGGAQRLARAVPPAG